MDRLWTWWKSAGSASRRLVAGSGAAAALVTIAVFWVARPERVVLFSGLDPADAAAIVEELEEANVRYDVTRSGTTIRVPADRVGEMRIRIAGRGLIGRRPLGYELLDRSSLGMTEFLQHVNHRRALEGELARTIASIAEVRAARVHLAIPERSVFRREERAPTASAIVELEPGGRLSAEQVRGVVALIAASVEGLGPSGVTLVDSSGRQLAEASPEEEIASGSEKLRLQREVEEHLREKASSLLEQVVGEGQVIVQVHADLDFERVERSVESWDPASGVVRSERVGPDGESILTNYEVDRTVATILGAVGTIHRLSVAVLVNGSFREAPDGSREWVERSPRELATLSAIVRDAVGWDESRGDSLEMANLRFADPPPTESAPAVATGSGGAGERAAWIPLLAIVAAAGVVGWMARRPARALVATASGRRPSPDADLGPERPAEGDIEARKEAIREEMHALARERPAEVAQVLRGWLVEEKSS